LPYRNPDPEHALRAKVRRFLENLKAPMFLSQANEGLTRGFTLRAEVWRNSLFELSDIRQFSLPRLP
jgi:hypothetical protein